MKAADSIRASLNTADAIWKAYVGDLSDEELLVRPVEQANHIAWQLGHLISSEHGMIEAVAPGSMPALPDGFAEKYTPETATVDDPSAFDSKEEYLRLFEEQRAGTLAALERQSEENLDKPAPEDLQQICATVGAVFGMQATHWLMHAGQWAVIRRKLGRAPLF